MALCFYRRMDPQGRRNFKAMMKPVLALLFSVISVTLWAAPSRVDQLEGKVEQMGKDMQGTEQAVKDLGNRENLLDEKVQHLTDIIQASNGSINNSLTATSNFLTVVTIILSILAAALALYVTYLERKMRSMKDAVEEMNKTVSEKEAEVKKLVEEINSNMEGLFKRIQREDTKAILKRLEEVPEDIDNLIHTLLTRVLLPEDYGSLKKAYMKLQERGTLVTPQTIVNGDLEITAGLSPGQAYLSVIFQHFAGKAVEDADMREPIVGFFKDGLDLAFDNDVRKEIEDLAEALSKKDADYDRKAVLKAFQTALSQSERTKDHPEYLALLQEKVPDASLWE